MADIEWPDSLSWGWKLLATGAALFVAGVPIAQAVGGEASATALAIISLITALVGLVSAIIGLMTVWLALPTKRQPERDARPGGHVGVRRSRGGASRRRRRRSGGPDSSQPSGGGAPSSE